MSRRELARRLALLEDQAENPRPVFGLHSAAGKAAWLKDKLLRPGTGPAVTFTPMPEEDLARSEDPLVRSAVRKLLGPRDPSQGGTRVDARK